MNLKTLHKLSYGLYVVSSKMDKKFNGQIANTVFQVTAEPATIAVSINKENLTHEFIRESKVFSASILAKETPLKFIGHFGFKSGREWEKFKEVKHKLGVTGAPLVMENSVGYLEAEVINSLDVGTHTLFIGKVVAGEIIKDEEPLSYAYYHQVKGGTTPRAAPVYIEEKDQKEVARMEKYKCTVCGYIYDPRKGDPDSKISPGTSFTALPDDWVCPVCGVGKDKFEKVD